MTWDREVVSERSAAEAGGTSGVVAYALEHPVDTATLAARRVGTALAQVPPHYSSRHNLFILVVLVPTYASAAWGVWVHRRHPLTRLALGVVGVQLAFIAGTFADYDGRFMAYVLPLVKVVAGAGAADAARRWTS